MFRKILILILNIMRIKPYKNYTDANYLERYDCPFFGCFFMR